jgi:glycosyltransferase involved in cell wall biosynthesis
MGLNIYLPNISTQTLGGGWTFRNNFIKGLKGRAKVVDTWEQSDIVLITGATMTNRDEIIEAKKQGRKIVFRIDNMPKDSRNRGTAVSRMKDFAMISDYIIFQSNWAKDYVGWWLKKLGVPAMPKSNQSLDGWENHSIIYNGIDPEFFYYKDNPADRPMIYMFIQFNRDENKRMPEAFYYFHQQFRQFDDKIELWCIGNFSPENVQYNFDFFAGEKIKFIPSISDPKEMGDIMRKSKYLLFPAYADASPNTVAEAMACGCKVLLTNPCGGTDEVIQKHLFPYIIEEMCGEYLDIFNKLTNESNEESKKDG